jgi:hypothetical protein
MSQNWPSADVSLVTAEIRKAKVAAMAAAQHRR